MFILYTQKNISKYKILYIYIYKSAMSKFIKSVALQGFTVFVESLQHFTFAFWELTFIVIKDTRIKF